jgi:hypothetical protein
MLNGEYFVWIPSTPTPGRIDSDSVDELDRRFAPDHPRRGVTPRPGIPPAKAPGFGHDDVDIILYVSTNSLNCGRAASALQRLLSQFPTDGVRLKIVDVAHDVERAIDDRVLFTPTLIVTDRQQRKTRVLGDLTNSNVLWDLLVASGLEPL